MVTGLLVGIVAGLLMVSGAGAEVIRARWTEAGRPATSSTAARFPGAVVNLAAGRTYPGFDNDVFEDCVAATAGDLIITSFDTVPGTADITAAFFLAGGTSTQGLAWAQLVAYWSSTRIAGTTLESWSRLGRGNMKGRVEHWLVHGGTVGRFNAQHEVIDMVELPSHAVVAGRPVLSGNHMWLIVGYTRRDALVVSWGSEFEVSWEDLLAWSAPRDDWGGFAVVAVSQRR